MLFQDTNSLKPFVKQYYNENIRKFLEQYKKDLIYFPKECSEQMAGLIVELAKSYGYDVYLEEFRKFDKVERRSYRHCFLLKVNGVSNKKPSKNTKSKPKS